MPAITIHPLEFSEKTGLSGLFLDHVRSLGTDGDLAAAIHKKCEERKDFPHRKTLHASLVKQYDESGIKPEGELAGNIGALLKDNSFTITSGHQLCVYTGPLYVVHKILSSIKACRMLNEKFPDRKFIPVHWMATEDHDVEEIASLNLFKQTLTVNFSFGGPTGELLSNEVNVLQQEMVELAGTLPHAQEINALFADCYATGGTLQHAHRKILHALFGRYGLVIVDGREKSLKEIFLPVLRDELINGTSGKKVSEKNIALEKEGYAARVSPRDVNLFLMGDKTRDRIERAGDDFKNVTTGEIVPAGEMLKLLEKEPGKFSPNVILRPLYECTILPDVAFIGGPAEIAYWLQLDNVFAHFGVPMPVRLPRHFIFYGNEKTALQLEELEHMNLGLFDHPDLWKSTWVREKHGKAVSFKQEQSAVREIFEALETKAVGIDKSLSGFIKAEGTRNDKFFQALEEKVIRSLKKKDEQEINGLQQLQDRFFPGGTWQERHESILFYLWKYGMDFTDVMLEKIPPFGTGIQVVTM